MASHFDDPSQWRLFNNNGTVKFKFLECSGGFEQESGNVTLRGLIPSGDIVTFLQETFPPAIQIGNLSVPQSAGLPGLPGMTARRVSFKNFIDGKPVDPFGFDPNAPAGTYAPVIEVNLEYGLNRIQQPDPTNPFTFLEISGDTEGDILYTTAPKAARQPKKQKTGNKPDSESPGPYSTASQGQGEGENDGAPVAVRDPTTQVAIHEPKTMWTVKWNAVPFKYFQQVLSYRMRWCVGRVNEFPMPVLHMAHPESVLFVGFRYTTQYTWRNGYIGTPPVNVEMKFLEKHVVWKGVIKGHNDVWIPNEGWQYLLIDGTSTPLYEPRNLNILFTV